MAPDQKRRGLDAWLRPPELAEPHEARLAASVHWLSIVFIVAIIVVLIIITSS